MEREIEKGEIGFCEECDKAGGGMRLYRLQEPLGMVCSRLAELSDVRTPEEAALFVGRWVEGVSGAVGKFLGMAGDQFLWDISDEGETVTLQRGSLTLLPLAYSPEKTGEGFAGGDLVIPAGVTYSPGNFTVKPLPQVDSERVSRIVWTCPGCGKNTDESPYATPQGARCEACAYENMKEDTTFADPGSIAFLPARPSDWKCPHCGRVVSQGHRIFAYANAEYVGPWEGCENCFAKALGIPFKTPPDVATRRERRLWRESLTARPAPRKG